MIQTSGTSLTKCVYSVIRFLNRIRRARSLTPMHQRSQKHHIESQAQLMDYLNDYEDKSCLSQSCLSAFPEREGRSHIDCNWSVVPTEYSRAGGSIGSGGMTFVKGGRRELYMDMSLLAGHHYHLSTPIVKK